MKETAPAEIEQFEALEESTAIVTGFPDAPPVAVGV